MANSYRNESGVGHALMVILLAVVVAAIAYVGVRVADMNNGVANVANQTANVVPVAQTTVPKQISGRADLQQAEKALDTTSAPDPSVLDSAIQNLY